MLKRFLWLDKAVDRVGYWGGLYAMLTAFWAWVGKELQWLQPYGWPEALVAGFIVATVTVVVFSIFLVAWRTFRPLSGTSLPSETTAQVNARDKANLEARLVALERGQQRFQKVQDQAKEAFREPKSETRSRYTESDRDRLSRVIAEVYDILYREAEPTLDKGSALYRSWRGLILDGKKDKLFEQLHSYISEANAPIRKVVGIIDDNGLFKKELNPIRNKLVSKPELGAAINELKQAINGIDVDPTDKVLDLLGTQDEYFKKGIVARGHSIRHTKEYLESLRSEILQT